MFVFGLGSLHLCSFTTRNCLNFYFRMCDLISVANGSFKSGRWERGIISDTESVAALLFMCAIVLRIGNGAAFAIVKWCV